MWYLSWLRNRQKRPAGRLARYRPLLEILEARTLLSTYLVDHLADDMVGTGTSGSLRYCITHAVDGDAISFGVTGTINLNSALPDLAHSISINGPGANVVTVRRNGDDFGPYFRIFTVPAAATVGISGLTIANGLNGDTAHGGGGIYNGGTLTLSNCTVTQNQTVTQDPNSRADGGGISNWSTATVNNCTITNNTANGFGGGVANEGAAVAGGTMTIANSTISGNTANGVGEVGFASYAYGGGIFNGYRPSGIGHGNLVVTNTTITGNVAGDSFDSEDARGGGIYSARGNSDLLSTLTINNCTISGNSAGRAGGGMSLQSTTGTMRNSIVAGNSAGDYAPDLDGDLTSSAYNLIGGNPLLGPLQDNGGPTQTMALLAGSPALNAGDPAQLGTADQRGVVRSGGVNIGAYQASATAFVLTAPDTVTAGMPFDVTVQAVDPFGQVALGYTGTVTFSTSDPDPGVVLPADYTFTPDDQGTHTFSSGFTLITPGDQTLTATDTADNTIIGGATVAVTDSGGGHAPTGSPSSRGAALDRRANLPSLDPFFTHVGADPLLLGLVPDWGLEA